MRKKEFFPDGSLIDDWFYEVPEICVDNNYKKYILTDYDIKDDGKVYTEKIQSLIDQVNIDGGGTIVVPKGTYITGALFFKSGVNLYIEEDGILMGSDDISDYPVCTTRIEGETCKYFPALINADGVDGLKICGKGTIDGNGQKSWKSFWIRRRWNPNCTNKDEQRPRLVYISNSKNILISGLKLQNSHFWTTHIYKSKYVKILECQFISQIEPTPAPSTDAIDIDACSYVHIKNCYFSVNDDGIALKGGKGPYADTAQENGANERVLIEDCIYNFCHGCLTCGSEAIHNKNIILRRATVKKAGNLLWLKMRPDTPQRYEWITIDGVTGHVESFININPWTQFFDLKGRKDIPLSYSNNITIRNCNIDCDEFFNVKAESTQYELCDFTFENLEIVAEKSNFEKECINNFSLHNVVVNGQEIN